MLIKNCNIIYLNKIENGSILIENGKIKVKLLKKKGQKIKG